MTSIRYFRQTTRRRKLALGGASGLVLGISIGVALFAGFGRSTPTASAGLAQAMAMASTANGSLCDNAHALPSGSSRATPTATASSATPGATGSPL